MSEIRIPITVTGPGKQPTEADGSTPDIMQMPSGMDTCATPFLPEPEEVQGLNGALDVLNKLLSQLEDYRVGQSEEPLDLSILDGGDLSLIEQVLGEGEVSVICSGRLEARIQESLLSGVWRVRYLDRDDRLLSDVIEVAVIPHVVTESTFAHAANAPAAGREPILEGVLNAPPLLAEIDDKLNACEVGDPAHVINLTLLSQTEQDLAYLVERLGQGGVTILFRGYGNCLISSTATRYVWWVQYFNSQGRIILNSLEITQVPNVACAAPEDIRDSAERLQEIMGLYR